jgi:histone H2A
MVIPANLGKHAVSEGVKAISKFTSAAAGSARKVRQQIRAGLKFPVARIGKYLKAQVKYKRKGLGAGIYLAAVMEYMCAEIIALTGNYARDHKRHRITPRAIAMVIANDSEMDHFFGKAIQFGGVLPHIEVAYLPSKSEKGPKSPKSKKSKKSPSPK